MFVSRYIIFLEKEFLLREDSGSKDELSEVQSDQTNTDQLTLSKVIIHINEVVFDPSKTQAHQ